jgi:hypothetical protein
MADRTESESLSDPAEATAGTAQHLFISYASHDAEVAQNVCSAMEAAGFGCWMAPRDVKPGAQYADAIVRALNEAQGVAPGLLRGRHGRGSSRPLSQGAGDTSDWPHLVLPVQGLERGSTDDRQHARRGLHARRQCAQGLRVTAQLIGTNDGSHLWSESYDEDVGDVLKVRDRIAAGIVRALQVRSVPTICNLVRY